MSEKTGIISVDRIRKPLMTIVNDEVISRETPDLHIRLERCAEKEPGVGFKIGMYTDSTYYTQLATLYKMSEVCALKILPQFYSHSNGSILAIEKMVSCFKDMLDHAENFDLLVEKFSLKADDYHAEPVVFMDPVPVGYVEYEHIKTGTIYMALNPDLDENRVLDCTNGQHDKEMVIYYNRLIPSLRFVREKKEFLEKFIRVV